MTTEEPLYIDTGETAPRPDMPFIERDVIAAVIRNPATDKYLCLRWKTVDWDTFVTGGIEDGQTGEEAARAEVREETGYKNLRLVRALPRFHAKFFHAPKNVNRYAHFQGFYFELENDERDPVEAKEVAQHEPVWLTKEELKDFRLPPGQRMILEESFKI